MANQQDVSSTILRERIRVSRQNKTALHRPPLSEASQLIGANLAIIAQQAEVPLRVSFLSDRKNELTASIVRAGARLELLKLAIDYSNHYLENNPAENNPAIAHPKLAGPIVISGHQPELYHPGVWYKNFVLSELAHRQSGVAINLVVDSDLANQNFVRYPDIDSNPARTETIAFDHPKRPLPHELREISDVAFFNSFVYRIRQSAFQSNRSRSDKRQLPLVVEELWPEVIAAADAFRSQQGSAKLGASIAAGRHRLEQSFGLNTLEIPVSQLSTTNAFAIFAASIFDRAGRFRDIYNAALIDYRTTHRIRSRSHPVPALKQLENWTEVPFWIYGDQSRNRRPLFIKSSAADVVLTDRNSLSKSISKNNFIDEFRSLSDQGVFIRPRALATTMFSRFFLSDVFLHGIGGAKYDQLTDVICQSFFGFRLPAFMTLSATMMLPSDETIMTKTGVAQLQYQRRKLKFHPELSIAPEDQTPEIVELLSRKLRWTDPKMGSVRSQEKHDAIESLNQKLRTHVRRLDESLQNKIENAKTQLRRSQIAGSREYSFCLFENKLISDLRSLAASQFRLKNNQ